MTTLRAAMVVGAGSAAFETILALVDRLPAMVCPRWVSTPTQPIAIDDVVRYLAASCGNGGALGQSFDVGGPEVMTYREMIERIGALRGRRPLIVEVPVLSPRLSSLLAPSGHAGRRHRRPSADRGTPQHDDRPRQKDSRARAVRPDLVP